MEEKEEREEERGSRMKYNLRRSGRSSSSMYHLSRILIIGVRGRRELGGRRRKKEEMRKGRKGRKGRERRERKKAG